MIGTREISTLAFGISVIKVFKQIAASRINMQSFLRHSLACGLMSRSLASQVGWRFTEELFVAGLLQYLTGGYTTPLLIAIVSLSLSCNMIWLASPGKIRRVAW